MRMSDLSFEHVLSRQYTVFDGLAGMHIEDLYQDREDFLWTATADGGVSRFDSVHFDNFGLKDGLPNLTVMAIAEDADGRLLFGTFGGGLAAYDGRGFQVYTTEHGLPSNEIVGLQAQSDGSVLVLTGAWTPVTRSNGRGNSRKTPPAVCGSPFTIRAGPPSSAATMRRPSDADNSFERYYMARRGKGGNEDYYYQERMGLVRKALFRRHPFVFKGDSYTGKVVFAPLYAEVRAITVEVEDMVLRVDAFDRPKEVTSASFAFAVAHEIAPVPPVQEAH